MNFLNKFFAMLEHNRKVQTTIKELESCTDRELADIGISRSDILRIARETGVESQKNEQYTSNNDLTNWV